MENQLFEFQKQGIQFLKSRNYALLADEMGLGKTVQAIKASEGLKRCLVLCPASVKYGWEREIKKWTSSSTFVVEGIAKKIFPSVTYTICNYDLLKYKFNFLPLLADPWDLLICDEAHYLKNNSAKRTKAVYYPKGLASISSKVWLLTGTPVLNRPIELFSHLKALMPGRLGIYTSRIEYGKKFCAAYKDKYGWNESGASNLPELSALLSSFMLRREKQDVLKDLPDKIYQTVYLTGDTTLIQRERESYEETKNSILGETASIRRQVGCSKIPQIVEHVTNILEEKWKVVVFAYHREVIHSLRHKFSAYNPAVLTGSTGGKERQDEVDKFRTQNSCRLFIGQIEAAGTGINGLQNVCDTVVFAEMSYVPGQIHQAIDRCHRIGQKNKVLVQFLVLKGSLDEDIAEAVARKEKIIEKIVKKSEVQKGEQLENILSRIAKVVENVTHRFV